MDHYSTHAPIEMISPTRRSQTARFEVNGRPVLLEADFCDWRDGFQLMRITRICGNQVNTEPYLPDGEPLLLNAQNTRLKVTEPGRYLLLSSNGVSKTAIVRRMTLGVQHHG